MRMASPRPPLSPAWRNALRTWLAATLAIGIMLWAGRHNVMMLALLTAVLFINENDVTPVRSIGQMVGGALVGILTAVVLHDFSTAWPMLGVGLVITGALVRGLGLLKGLGMGYMSCWSVEVLALGRHFNWALVFNLSFAVVVGIAMAQVAAWVFWPRRPQAQLAQLERGLAEQLAAQIAEHRRWLGDGGSPPPVLRSQELLPQIAQLQNLWEQRQGLPNPRRSDPLSRRLAQSGAIWRQLLRQWLLLEPLLRQISTPLPLQAGEPSLLIGSLEQLEQALLPNPAALSHHSVPRDPGSWLMEAHQLNSSPPLLLSIAQQSHGLARLLQSRARLIQAIDQIRSPAP